MSISGNRPRFRVAAAPFIGATAAVLIFSLGSAFGASEPVLQERPQTGLQNVVHVGMKLVQVFVTDRVTGRPVTGLRAEEFTVFDNGVPQVLAAFEVHARPAPEAVPSSPTAPSAPASSARVFLFVFDYFMNDPQGISRSKAAALEFLQAKALPSDQIGILSFSHIDGFNVLLDPTVDHARARKTVAEMKGVPRMKSSSEFYFITGLQAAEKNRIYREVQLYCRCMEDLAKALAEIEGFKNVLFFSRGLSTDIFLSDDDYGLSFFDWYQSMLDEIALSQSPFFTINTLGIRGPSGINGWRYRGVDALVGLSKATGGSYFPTGDYAKPLSETIDLATSHYYILGYRLDPDWHGRFHEIKVVVHRTGCEIRSPRGYVNPKSFSDFSLGERHGQLEVLARGMESAFLVPLEIPLTVLTLAPAEPGRDSDCLVLCDLARPELRDLAGSSPEVALFIFNEKGEMMSFRLVDFSFVEWKAGSLCPYFAETLPPGRYEAGIVLRNGETGMASVGRISFSIAHRETAAANRAANTRLELDPPFLFRPGTETGFYRLSGTPGKTRPLSIKDVYPFVSADAAPVIGILDAGPAPLRAVVRVRPPDPDSHFSWSAAFLSRSGEEIPVKTDEIAAQEAEGATAFLLEIDRPQLEPGEYILRLKAVCTDSGREAEVEIPLHIR